MNIDNIVIVGGGSAGWMTAAILIKSFPEKSITVIESPKIQKIGVGESTFQGINYYLEYLEIDRKDFFSNTDASLKLAIKFKDFYKKGGEPDFIYPFGNPLLDGTAAGLQDWLIKKVIYPETPVNDFADSYFPAAHLIKNKRMSDNTDKSLDNFDPLFGTALHFDAIKFGNWLKANYAIPLGVSYVMQEVKDIHVSEDGIEKIVLEDGQEIFADLFVDCTGFRSLLISECMNEKFIDYTNILPNTHAWATRVDYKNKDKELDVVTKCTALKNGWCWNIPLWSRLGAGYVYSDKYITHEEALEEFKEYLQNDLEISRSRQEVDQLNFNNIAMRVGIHENVWTKNVVAIGLAAGFIEPLESNGLFSVHEFLFELVRSLQRGKVSQWDKDIFNYTVKTQFDQFVEFIRIHYSLSLRDDSKYWRDNLNRKFDVDESRKKDPNARHIYDIQSVKTDTFVPPTNGGLTWITSGMNYMLLDPVTVRLAEINYKADYKKEMEPFFKKLEEKKKRWENASLKSQTIQEYLKNKYYQE